ncbi:S9 family peptidase [Anaerolinea sp.]|uniref:S9 family peptidase n=1 Tax=Anaerolinea sp. TaxID=1872519 RepID=UPI002ACE430D|nr:S9 family peptidase [Anaerolinea sp.]
MASHIKPFGLWESPISPQLLSRRVRFEDVQWTLDGQFLMWTESRSSQTVPVLCSRSGVRRDLNAIQSLRGGVGYGGGEFSLSEEYLLFVERDGRIYAQPFQHGTPRPITPPFGACASPVASPDGKWVVFVWSDGIQDVLGIVDSRGQQWPQKLATGADFYMQPAWHPQGKYLAWVEWNQPNMPWDGSRVMLATLEGTTPVIQHMQILGGDDHTPVFQPAFSPDGQWLCFVEGGEEWDRLILFHLSSGARQVLYAPEQAHLMVPAWVQGLRTLAWAPDSQSIYIVQNALGQSNLSRISIDGKVEIISTSPYTWLSQITVSHKDGALAFIASSPNTPNQIVILDQHGFHTLAYSEPEMISPEFYPVPESLTWETSGGMTAYGLYYPPSNPQFQGRGLPPAIFNVHGGPTSQATMAYNPEAAYFTSRGYAYVEVNYRGSTGYGRRYREALKGNWGKVDVEDAFTCAQALAERQLADPKRLIIKGGSAGGYTVLNALAHFPGTFKAGVCLYGVSNLFMLDMDTHKFEARYTASLVGELPEAAQKYHDWSPVFHARNIRDPLIIFQGSEDKVVPPNQSEVIVKALQQTGTPHRYILYEGEGHGFRKSETILNYYQELERFLLQYVLFAP